MILDKVKLFRAALEEDTKLDIEVTESVVLFGQFLGTHLLYFKTIYAMLLHQETHYESKPIIGAKFSITFDYEVGLLFYDRLDTHLEFPLSQFWRFMGLVDSCFSPIYPLGTVVELDEGLFPEPVRKMFQDSKLGARVLFTGRKTVFQTGFVVDYTAVLWPYGQTQLLPVLNVSNLMIKREITKGLTNEEEERFALTFLRYQQVSQGVISFAFMNPEERRLFLEKQTESSESEAS